MHLSPKESKRKKSSKKIRRERAARFQAKKRQEQTAASAASGDPPPAACGDPPTSTSSPTESSVEEVNSVDFSFASPAAADLTNYAMEGVSDLQLSPEDLRQQVEDPPSLTLSPNEEIVRERHSEPILENITIPEEVVQTDQKTLPRRLSLLVWASSLYRM